LSRNQKIGLEYHTHALLVEYPQTEHEEWKTARRIREQTTLNRGNLERFEKKLGDLIVEMTKDHEIFLHGYTPAKKPYLYRQSDHGFSKIRTTHSLRILVPERNISYHLPV